MMTVVVLLILSFCLLVVGQLEQQFAIQYIGDYVSEAEEAARNFCESKYCLLDANNLFVAASQNKSVRPCDDFKEFALGTFIKYRAINDRDIHSGFGNDVHNKYLLRLRKALAAKVNDKDTNVTRTIKRFYAQCVSSEFISQKVVNEFRDYLNQFGLKFYPEINNNNLNLRKFIEQQPELVMNYLLRHYLTRVDYRGNFGYLQLNQFRFLNKNKWFASLKDILYDMNQVYLNSSFAGEYKQEFSEISRKQEEFYDLLEKVFNDKPEQPKVEYITINELNQLTSSLKIDWVKVINKLLLTKVSKNEVIAIYDPDITRKIAKVIASTDMRTIADFMVYNFLAINSPFFIVYNHNEWTYSIAGVKRGRERWVQCASGILYNMGPAVEFLYLNKYKDDEMERSMEKFARESIAFAIRKIKKEAEWEEEVLRNVIKRLQLIELVVGYPKEFADVQKIDEMYVNLHTEDKQNFVNISFENINNHERILREPVTSKRRNLEELAKNFDSGFKYFPYNNVLYIPLMFLDYPFYHKQRPRFFNTATVSNLIFEALFIGLRDYLEEEWKVTNFESFKDEMQVSYEFYDEWLNSGGIDLELGANRLTSRQLFWVAAARHFYAKVQPSKIKSPDFFVFEDVRENLHKRFSKNRGFREAFQCKN